MFLDRVSKFPRIINVGGLDIRGKAQPQRQRDDRRDVHGDDVRAARYPWRTGQAGRRRAEEDRMRSRAFVLFVFIGLASNGVGQPAGDSAAACLGRAVAGGAADAARRTTPTSLRAAATRSSASSIAAATRGRRRRAARGPRDFPAFSWTKSSCAASCRPRTAGSR